MTSITIPKNFTNDDLVIISKKEYQRFSVWQKREAEADKDIRNGNISRAFTNSKDLISALKKK